MKWLFLRCLLAVCLLTIAAPGQRGGGQSSPDQEEQDVKLPNGKSQRDELLKAEHADNIRDATKLVELAEDLKADITKNDRFVLSMATLKKTDDIEKLVKKIRSRLRH